MGTAVLETPTAKTGCYRVLHVFDHSWPVLSGYSVRSRNLVRAQHDLGYEPVAVTGPLHQLDSADGSEIVVDGSKYRRTHLPPGLTRRAIAGRWPFLREAAVVKLLRQRILQLLQQEQFEVVHAHSPALCGLAASQACRSRNVPFVYEIRAFWEEGGKGRGSTAWEALRYSLTRRLELHVARNADAVVGIADHILQDLRARGIPTGKLFHVPNGVDAASFAPQPRDLVLARQLNLEGSLVFGFIGSLYHYEGVSWLVQAVMALRRSGVPCKLLIIGEGEDTPEIKRTIRELGAAEFVLAPGRVPHSDVHRYYSVMDIMVYPRRRSRLTETVTPLKPLEAMALAKPVLASEVGGIRELVQPEQTGLLFAPENIEDFCRQARRLVSDQHLRRTLGDQARDAVLKERDWKTLATRYQKVYEFAISAHQ